MCKMLQELLKLPFLCFGICSLCLTPMYGEQSYAYFDPKIKIFVLVSFYVLGPCAIIYRLLSGCHFQQILFIRYLENLYKN
jgi:hypothetical protein